MVVAQHLQVEHASHQHQQQQEHQDAGDNRPAEEQLAFKQVILDGTAT